MKTPPQQQPPWEVLVLLTQRFDPKTLALSSCVSRTWFRAMSSEHLWTQICADECPSLSFMPGVSAAVSRRRLYSLYRSAAARRVRAPQKPRLALSDLLFAVSVSTKSSSSASNNLMFSALVKPSTRDAVDDGVFYFDVAGGDSDTVAVDGGAVAEVKLTWSVVARGWSGVFVMMECDGKVHMESAAEGWFSGELPGPGCCCSGPTGGGSGVVADLRVWFGRSNNNSNNNVVRVERVRVGILNVVIWRYISIDDGLRYLQNFLPCSS